MSTSIFIFLMFCFPSYVYVNSKQRGELIQGQGKNNVYTAFIKSICTFVHMHKCTQCVHTEEERYHMNKI